jgi:GT2 family glycosyltransferase
MIASLVYNTPELVPVLRAQIADIFIIDAGSTEQIDGANLRYEDNRFWVGNWDRFLRSTNASHVWALNSDITGASIEMYNTLLHYAISTDAFIITPSFNSPHKVFESIGNTIRSSNWVDMAAPLINVKKYKQLGGFDLSFKGYFADIDLCFRAKQENMKMYIDDTQSVSHLGGYTTIKEAKHEQANLADNDLLINKYGKSWHELI